MHYTLKVLSKTEYGVFGKICDENGKDLSHHLSSDVEWLESDLLNDIDFDQEKDTYEIDKSDIDEYVPSFLDENDYTTNHHIEYVIEYEHTTGCSGCGNGCGGTNRYDSFDSAVERLRYMLERNKDYVQFINIKFYKIVKTVFDVCQLPTTKVEGLWSKGQNPVMD